MLKGECGMITAILLLILGLLFIFIEFYLPGGVMAIIGALALAASIIFFAIASQSVAESFFYTLFVLVCVGLLIRYTLRKIPRQKSGYSIYLDKDQEGYRASEYDPAAIGKTGVVIADLKPGGYIIVEGTKHQAISQSGYISQGEKVDIIGGQEDSLIVTKRTEHHD